MTKKVLQKYSLYPVEKAVTVYTSFHHLFDEGSSPYAAGYYSYMWAEIIEAQVW
jgi:Zn-dependent oligopeptidase